MFFGGNEWLEAFVGARLDIHHFNVYEARTWFEPQLLSLLDSQLFLTGNLMLGYRVLIRSSGLKKTFWTG